MFGTVFGLLLLAVLIPVAFCVYAQRAYNQRRHAVRVAAIRDWIASDEAEKAAYLAQIREDTCTDHGVFCCDRCFDMTPVS